MAARALGESPAGVVAAVGIAGMAETGVLLDRRGEPVGPAIAWHDDRGADEARAIARELGARRFAAQTGLPASPLCTLSKLALAARPVGAAAAVRWLGLPEWVARSLGAADVAELSLASRTGMLSLRERAWWPDALAWLGVPEGFLAEPVPAGTPIGRVGDALPGGTRRRHHRRRARSLAATVGAGATAEGDVLHSSGTADVFVRSVREPLEPERIADAVANGVTVGWHVVPERWALLSGNELNVALASVLQLLGVDGQAERDALDTRPPRLAPGERRCASKASATRGAVAARHRARHEPRPRVAGRARGGRRPQRRDARAQRGGGRAADADRRDRRRRRAAPPRAPSRRSASGPIEWSPVQEATARGAAVLAGIAAGLYASVDDAPAVASGARGAR